MLVPFPGAETRLRSYYSGDVIEYNGYVVVATTNSGALELFKWREGENFIKIASLKSVNERFATFTDYYSTVLHVEDGDLFVYAVDGQQIHKYAVEDLKRVKLINKAQDAMWDWFGSLTIVDDRVASTGSKGIKIWNRDLQVIDSYQIPLTADNSFNVTTAGSKKYLFNVADSKVSILDGKIEVLFVQYRFNLIGIANGISGQFIMIKMMTLFMLSMTKLFGKLILEAKLLKASIIPVPLVSM